MATKETAANKIESPELIPSNPEPPIRILVQTMTHLVPGTDNYDRTFFVLNLVCQLHWGCDFESPRFRWASYNDQFAFNNLRCFFLVDHGESDNDDDVPVLYYEWTGEVLKPQPKLAQDPEIQAKLKTDATFTIRPSKREKPPIRRIMKMRLYCDDNLPPDELDHMREHPEDLEWLKLNVRPRLWRKFVAAANKYKPRGAADIAE